MGLYKVSYCRINGRRVLYGRTYPKTYIQKLKAMTLFVGCFGREYFHLQVTVKKKYAYKEAVTQ